MVYHLEIGRTRCIVRCEFAHPRQIAQSTALYPWNWTEGKMLVGDLDIMYSLQLNTSWVCGVIR